MKTIIKYYITILVRLNKIVLANKISNKYNIISFFYYDERTDSKKVRFNN